MKQKETVRFYLKHKKTGLYFDGYDKLVSDKRYATIFSDPNAFDSYKHEEHLFVCDEIGFLAEETHALIEWSYEQTTYDCDIWTAHIPMSEFEKETFISYGEPKFIVEKSGSCFVTARCWSQEEVNNFVMIQLGVDEDAVFEVTELDKK